VRLVRAPDRTARAARVLRFVLGASRDAPAPLPAGPRTPAQACELDMSASHERKLRDARDVLATAGLRPIVDTKLCRVLADCPVCRVGGSDPLQIHRPLGVACWTARPEDPVRVLCWSGCDPASIQQAITAPEPDWQAIAEAATATAEGAVAVLEAILAASHAEPELAAA